MLGLLLLGADAHQRHRLRLSLKWCAVQLAAALIVEAAIQHQHLPPRGHWIALSAALVPWLFPVLIRSGWNLSLRHPTLAIPQTLLAITHAATIYALGGATRDLILLLTALTLAYNAPRLHSIQARLSSGYALFAMGAAMAHLVVTAPDLYDVGGEMLRFMMMALAVFIAWQSGQHAIGEETTWLSSVIKWLVTDDPRQRVRILRFFVAAANFAICTAVLAYAISVRAVDPQEGLSLTGYMVAQSLIFYALLRSGLNLRFADPALTMPQIIVAITCVVWSYAILHESRGASLMLLVMVLVFGMFNLTAREARIASFFALALQGVVMLGMVSLHPQRYTPRQELIHFLFACTTLPTISLLSGQLSNLRERLKQRKDDLAVALERIQTLATRDDLTRLYNRRHMMEALAQQARSADGSGRVFCLVMIDIDFFKDVNDTHGHGVGDEVLRSFAELVQSQIGASDLLARWGGEEFLLMLSDCRAPQAQACMQRIHRCMADANVSTSQPGLRVSFSAGAAERIYGEDIVKAIERADRALYLAKRSGRQCTVVSPLPEGTY